MRSVELQKIVVLLSFSFYLWIVKMERSQPNKTYPYI